MAGNQSRQTPEGVSALDGSLLKVAVSRRRELWSVGRAVVLVVPLVTNAPRPVKDGDLVAACAASRNLGLGVYTLVVGDLVGRV